MHVTPIPLEAADAPMAELAARDSESMGYLPNYTSLFTLHPAAYAGWKTLGGAIRTRMRLRRFELATIAAAQVLHCRYCVSAHGSQVVKGGLFTREQLEAVLRDPSTAGLEPEEVAVMALAAQVARDSSGVSPAMIETLRQHGLTDPEIFDVVLAAAARCFFAKVLDAMGAEPDAALAEMTYLADIGADASPRC